MREGKRANDDKDKPKSPRPRHEINRPEGNTVTAVDGPARSCASYLKRFDFQRYSPQACRDDAGGSPRAYVRNASSAACGHRITIAGRATISETSPGRLMIGKLRSDPTRTRRADVVPDHFAVHLMGEVDCACGAAGSAFYNHRDESPQGFLAQRPRSVVVRDAFGLCPLCRRGRRAARPDRVQPRDLRDRA